MAEPTPYAVKAALQRLFLAPPADEVLRAAAERARRRFLAHRFDHDISRLFGLDQLPSAAGAPDRVLNTDDHAKS